MIGRVAGGGGGIPPQFFLRVLVQHLYLTHENKAGGAAMEEVKIHLSGSHPIDIHCDDDTRPCNGFLLLAHVPADPPGVVMLNYGSSNATGNALMTLWQRSVQENPELAWVMEQVARGIVQFADAERSRWPSDDRSGKA